MIAEAETRPSVSFLQAGFFALFCFLFSGIQMAVNWGGGAYVSPGEEQLGYYLGTGCLALGFFLYALLAKHFGFLTLDSKAQRRNPFRLFPAVCMGLGAGLLILFFLPGAPLYLIGCALMFFLLGLFGGHVYYRMAMGLAVTAHRGMIIGAGSAAGGVAQTLAFNTLGKEPLLILLLLFLALIPYVERKAFSGEKAPSAPAETDAAGGLPPARNTGEIRKDGFSDPPKAVVLRNPGKHELLRLLIVLCCLIFMTGIYDHWLELVQTDGGRAAGFHALNWPRYLMGPVYLLYGFLIDRFGPQGISLAALCVSFSAVLMPVFLRIDEPMATMSVFYLLISSIYAYLNQMLIRLAPLSKHPAFWACSGRIADNLIVLIVAVSPLSGLGLIPVILLDLALFSVITICMALNGYLAPGEAFPMDTPPEAAKLPGNAPDMESFAGRFGLTEREKEVLTRLLESEDTVDAIAGKLSITRRQVQRHIASLYEKTGTQSRAGLVRLFYAAGARR